MKPRSTAKPKKFRLRPFFNKNTVLPLGIQSDADAKLFSNELKPGERKLLFDALRKITADQYNEHKKVVDVTIDHEDLVKVWYMHFIPMFVYGFIDEAFLIIGGESINNVFSVYNGMSMLASAAVANIICNLFIQLPAERCTDMMGFKKPVLSNDQINTPEYQHASFAAKLCGLWLGLTLGMLPLFFIDDNLDRRASDSREFLSGTKSEWYVMEDEKIRQAAGDEYCEPQNE
uniref:Transmembrane protein 65 n=1 Tax=Caenorhabditis tropicalis TaxID=1561998 RepID=A0A1I7ULP2_9PELO